MFPNEPFVPMKLPDDPQDPSGKWTICRRIRATNSATGHRMADVFGGSLRLTESDAIEVAAMLNLKANWARQRRGIL